MRSRTALAAAGILLLAPLAACSADTEPSGGDAGSSSAPALGPDDDPDDGTAGAPSSAQPSVTATESTVTGPCPYLDQDFIELTVGQRIGTVTVTTTTPPAGPLPRCEFQRGSGEPAAVIDTLTIDPGMGLEKALELVPGGNPVTAGEGGSVVVHQGQAKTELAAFEGTTLVLVTINQESSLEATEIASEVLATLG